VNWTHSHICCTPRDAMKPSKSGEITPRLYQASNRGALRLLRSHLWHPFIAGAPAKPGKFDEIYLCSIFEGHTYSWKEDAVGALLAPRSLTPARGTVNSDPIGVCSVVDEHVYTIPAIIVLPWFALKCCLAGAFGTRDYCNSQLPLE